MRRVALDTETTGLNPFRWPQNSRDRMHRIRH